MQRGSGSQFKRLEQGSAKCLEPILTHAATYPCHARGQLGVLWVLCGRECSSFQISPPSAALRGTAADIIVVGVPGLSARSRVMAARESTSHERVKARLQRSVERARLLLTCMMTRPPAYAGPKLLSSKLQVSALFSPLQQ